jgi:methyl-accepting chemotaxis protein
MVPPMISTEDPHDGVSVIGTTGREWDLTSASLADDGRADERLHELAHDVRRVVQGLQTAATRFSVEAARSSAAVGGISATIHDLSKELENIAATLTELQSTAEDAARAGSESAELSRSLADEVQRGAQVLSRVISAMAEMQAQSERVERLVGHLEQIETFSEVIRRVADKTKLLALNATIEAARAGEHGNAFRVVADEIGRLATDTELRTREIAGVLSATHDELEPIREAIDAGRVDHDGVADAEAANDTLQRIGALVGRSTEPAARVAEGAEQQLQALQRLSEHLDATVRAATDADEHARHVSQGSFGLSAGAEGVFELLRPFRTGSHVDRATAAARRLATELGTVFEEAIAAGQIALADVLELRYEEIAGPAIQSLARLFDVSKVPESGFSPTKFATAYDAAVDEAMSLHMEAVLAREPGLMFAIPLDLNAYAPMHNLICCQAWTGDAAQDLVGNRIKRFFWDNDLLVRGARVGLQGHVDNKRAERAEFVRAGCDLQEPAGGDDRYLVQTYARDTGALLSVLTVPVYVQGQRWGAALVGWDPATIERSG